MNNARKNRDDDTIPVKPFSLTLIVLSSAGAGLAAGLFICWLFCGNCDMQSDVREASNRASISQVDAEKP